MRRLLYKCGCCFKLSFVQCYGRAELQSALFEVQEAPLPMLNAPGEAARGSAAVCSRLFFFQRGGDDS